MEDYDGSMEDNLGFVADYLTADDLDQDPDEPLCSVWVEDEDEDEDHPGSTAGLQRQWDGAGGKGDGEQAPPGPHDLSPTQVDGFPGTGAEWGDPKALDFPPPPPKEREPLASGSNSADGTGGELDPLAPDSDATTLQQADAVRTFMGEDDEASGTHLSSALRAHVAAELSRETAIQKERRKAQEARDARFSTLKNNNNKDDKGGNKSSNHVKEDAKP